MFSTHVKSAAVVAFCAFCTPGWAEPSPVVASVEARDVVALEGLSGTAATADEQRLASGAALALRHKDEAALAILEPISRSKAEKDIRAAAYRASSDLYLRQGRYADAHTALQCAQDLSGKKLTGEALQALGWTDILAAEKPMRLAAPVTGKLEVMRDTAGLIRVPVEINGKSANAVIDTDSSFSVLSESAARRLGVRVLEKGATILTSTQSDLPMHLGVADELKFGDAVFSNVVFAVLPDKAVQFARGYKMDVVVGLPVFVGLDRIEFANENGWQSLYYGAKPGAAGEANMLLTGLDPFVLVTCEKARGPLRLAIDSAASATTLNGTALKDFPVLGEGALHGWARWEGGGGAATDYDALTVPEMKFAVGGRSVALRRINILSAVEPDRHGAIGQDVLKQGKRWALDFAAMSFTIGD